MKYQYETVTLPHGQENKIILRDYEIFGCDHDHGIHDVIKPIIRKGYERAMSTAALLRESGYARIVINPSIIYHA